MYARALGHSCQNVGRTIKRTKQKHVWEFDFELSEYEAERHEVILYYSVVSGKRQIYLDGQKISSCVGQYGDLQMKFLIDKYKNVALIQVDSDGKYTLLINNVKFKDLYQAVDQAKKNNKSLIENRQISQTATHTTTTQKIQQRKRMSLQEYNLEEDASDEDTRNHVGLIEDRYFNNIPNGTTKGNPQLFDGPLVKGDFNQEATQQVDARFKSFGLDDRRNDDNIPDKAQTIDSKAQKEIKNNTTNDVDPCPFFGQNFDSWLVNDPSKDKSKQDSPSKPQFQQLQEHQEHQSLTQATPKSPEQQPYAESKNISQETKQPSITINSNTAASNTDDIFGLAANTGQDAQQRSITFGFGKNIQNSIISDQDRTATMAWPSWETFNKVEGNINNNNNSNTNINDTNSNILSSNTSNINTSSNNTITKTKDPINLFALMEGSDPDEIARQFAKQEYL